MQVVVDGLHSENNETKSKLQLEIDALNSKLRAEIRERGEERTKHRHEIENLHACVVETERRAREESREVGASF